MVNSCSEINHITNNNSEKSRSNLNNNLTNNSDKNGSFDDLIFKVLTDCVNQQSESEISQQIDEFSTEDALHDYFKMLAISDTTTSQDINDENNILGRDGQISLAYENLRTIPQKIAEQFSSEAKFLDLSFNNFKDLSFLLFFKGLNTLILDKNFEPDETTLPYLPNLQILWLNNCNITNIPKWIFRIQIQCPKIKQLSLIGNPGARTLLTGASAAEEEDYRLYITESLKSLTHLDGVLVTPASSNAISSSTIVGKAPLLRSAFAQGALNQRTEFSLPSLLQNRRTTNQQVNLRNNNSSILFKNNSLNSKIIHPTTGKLSSPSNHLKNYYFHNNQQQYQQNKRNVLRNTEKDNIGKTSNKSTSNNSTKQSVKKRNLTSSFKNLFSFNSRRNSYQSSSTS